MFNAYIVFTAICVVDKNAVNTLDNKTYDAELGDAYHVMFQYVPDFARQHEHREKYLQKQEEQQTEQYVVLVRDSKNSKDEKEVKMTIRTPESQGQLVEIDMKATPGDALPEVLINKKPYKYDDKEVTEVEDGLVRFYALPEGELKLVVRDAFYVIYDGERVKLTVRHDKFRDAVRGLCGTFSGEETDDFTTPENCILEDPEQFVATYAVEKNGRIQELKSQAEKAECQEKDTIYANVISDYDVGRAHQEYKKSHNKHRSSSDRDSESCTKHQTKYVKDDHQVCFTVRPVPACKSSCSASNTIKKNVPVHCVEKSNVSKLWVEQIEKGHSPDFSQKNATKNFKIEVPESCSRY